MTDRTISLRQLMTVLFLALFPQQAKIRNAGMAASLPDIFSYLKGIGVGGVHY